MSYVTRVCYCAQREGGKDMGVGSARSRKIDNFADNIVTGV
jgi:hypothetical protein